MKRQYDYSGKFDHLISVHMRAYQIHVDISDSGRETNRRKIELQDQYMPWYRAINQINNINTEISFINNLHNHQLKVTACQGRRDIIHPSWLQDCIRAYKTLREKVDTHTYIQYKPVSMRITITTLYKHYTWNSGNEITTYCWEDNSRYRRLGKFTACVIAINYL